MDIDLVFHIPQSKTKEPNAQGCVELPTTHGNEYPTLLHSASCAEVAELIHDARMLKRRCLGQENAIHFPLQIHSRKRTQMPPYA
jgi:hypothetical protein